MDRVRVLSPALLALVALLGEQQARLGPLFVPAIGFRWVAAALVAAFLLTPRRNERRLGARDAAAAAVLGIAFVSWVVWRSSALGPPVSLIVTLDGNRTVVAETLQLEARRELRRLTGRRRNVTVSTEALIEVPRDGDYRVELDCDDACQVVVGTTRVRETGTVSLERGEAPFSLVYRQLGGPAKLVVGWNTPSAIELLPFEYFLRAPGAPSRTSQRLQVYATLVLGIVWWAAVSMWLAHIAPLRGQIFERRWVPASAAIAVLLYGCLLRYDAFLVHSGQDAQASLRPWVPSYGVFNPESAPDDPYRADVRSYLDRAETLTWTSFYAPSFREPFYVALTKPFLSIAGGEIGILIQSLVFSCAALVLFALVATELHGIWWATALLVPLALHEWLILEAPTGYRMSAYAFFLLATVAAMFVLPASRRGAVASGVLAGLLCLIRLSALSVVVPLLVLKVLSVSPRDRVVYGGIVLGVLIGLVGPFLVSNAISHGDPFYSISFHTEFWMRAEGLDTSEGPVSWTRYFTDFGRTGALLEGTIVGMTALPFRTFWTGLHHFPILDAVVLGLGVLGLVVSFRTEMRFLPVAYLGHLIPFAYIQNFPSGQMPRFVMPAYFFLVLAIPAAISARSWKPGRGSAKATPDGSERAAGSQGPS